MSNVKVLVADDEVQYVDVLAFKFRNAGLEVLMARDGQEALQLALAEKPALIVSDYQMPFLDGVELCRWLRAKPEMANVPFLLLTAHGLEIDEDRLAASGVTQVIGKPFSPRELLAKVTDLLNRSASAALAGSH